ncbi:MAG: DNA topoisomerase VI subunit B [Planctomycetota bacterium]|nr:DNA topoisomerase VI subunit B [Planctomycetota bacterium]
MAARRKRAKAKRKAARKKAPARRKKAAKKKARRKAASKKKASRKKPAPKAQGKATKRAAKKPKRRMTAKEMAKTQREISVAEFFAKNRHLLGYDNPSKALLTVVREAVDNALDACEEAGILPDIQVVIRQVKTGTRSKREAAEAGEAPKKTKRTMPKGTGDRYHVTVTDNGPGIVVSQINKIFGKLLYGSKFHRLRMSRGQQGIGISAAVLYGQLTTGRSVRITSRTSRRKPAKVLELAIDTRTNNPQKLSEGEDKTFKQPNGTRIELELEGRYATGPRSVLEYLRQTALANPHAQFDFTSPTHGEKEAPIRFKRAVKDVPETPEEIKPHPYGVELGALIKMLETTAEKKVTTFLKREFCRVSPKVAKTILESAGISDKAWSKQVARNEAEALHAAMNTVRVMAPPTDCLAPIGEEALERGLKKEVEADFFTTVTRSPSVYRGNPFQIEAGVAYGGELGADGTAKLYRFANRVPLLYQQGACAMTKAVSSISWRSYDLQQPRGGLPVGPLVIMVHIASVWVPFTSESKEAVAAYEEIHKEIRLALQECGRRLGIYVRKKKRLEQARKKTDYIATYLPAVAEALRDLLELSDRQTTRVTKVLGETLRKSRTM